MLKTDYLEFNFIYIIQSLRENELQTGSELYNETIQIFIDNLKSSGIFLDAVVINVCSAATLFAFLEKVRAEVESGARFPILHIEIHGSLDHKGLCLSSNEVVEWSDLIEPLTKINCALKNNLLLTLAVCSGVYLGTILRATQPAPFWGILGPDGNEWNGVLFEAFSAFYKTLLREFDVNKAVQALNAAAKTGKANANFVFVNAERMFARSFSRYVKEKCNSRALAKRNRHNISVVKQFDSNNKNKSRNFWRIWKKMVIKRMPDARYFFKVFRRVYFMIDIYPANDARFPMTYDQAMELE